MPPPPPPLLLLLPPSCIVGPADFGPAWFAPDPAPRLPPAAPATDGKDDDDQEEEEVAVVEGGRGTPERSVAGLTATLSSGLPSPGWPGVENGVALELAPAADGDSSFWPAPLPPVAKIGGASVAAAEGGGENVGVDPVAGLEVVEPALVGPEPDPETVGVAGELAGTAAAPSPCPAADACPEPDLFARPQNQLGNHPRPPSSLMA